MDDVNADRVARLRDALEEVLPWVEEWAELSDYPPGKAKMRVAIDKARRALADLPDPPNGG